MNLCARCKTDFGTVSQFDAHPCMTASPGPDATAVLRTRRRTSIVTIGPDTVRLCDPGCRDEVLPGLGLKGSGGGSAFRSHGEADVHVTWNGHDYRVTWKRCPASALPCDACGPQWRYRAGAPRRALTDAQREALERGRVPFVSTAEAQNRENPAA
jgi:hypothetical protein